MERPQGQLDELISATAREIGRLAVLGHRLQALISGHVAAAGQIEGAVEDAQMLDYLIQHLEGVEQFLDRLAATAPRGCHVDVSSISAGLALGALSRRLAGGAGPDGADDAGEMELL